MENFDLKKYISEGKLNEAVAEEESVADYLINYFRKFKKRGEPMVTDDIIYNYFKTHKDWDLIWGKSYKYGLDDFNKFFISKKDKLNENQDDSYYIDEIKRDLEELDDKEANEYLEELAKSILKLKR